MNEIKVMLVEDHVLVRQGTKDLLDRKEGIQVVAEAGDGEEAIRLANERCPDVILMDIALPKLNGIEATKQIKAANAEVAVLVLTAYDDDEYVFAFLEAGAAGYLLKDVSIDELVKAIQAVHLGDSVLHPAVTRKVVDYFAQRATMQPANERPESAVPHLTKREQQVLKLAAKGMTNREIAGELSISARTVQVHLSNVFGKLDVGSRTEAVLYAVREGWLCLEETS
jgi:DNA-binding NarL/FixJ family response regulator